MAQTPFDPVAGKHRDLAQGGPSGSDDADTARIQNDIERTRVEMSETLGEIQDRLRPDHLLQQARDGVTQAATGKVRHMMNSAGETASAMASRARGASTYVADYATANPIRVAAAVGALTWWLLRRRSQSQPWLGLAETQWDGVDDASYDSSTSAGTASRLRDTVGGYASTARETVNEYATSARETVGEYAESARLGARRASERVRTAASSATTTADEWIRENPMAAGAIAVAVGAAIALSVPRTDWEDGTMGETRDRAWEKATRVANNLKETVTQKVTTAAENMVGDSIAQAAQTPPGDSMGRV